MELYMFIFIQHFIKFKSEYFIILLLLIGFLVFIIFFARFIIGLINRRKQENIPPSKLILLLVFFVVFLAISYIYVTTDGEIRIATSLLAGCLFSLFIVLLQDFQGHKSELEIESIFKIVNGEQDGFLTKIIVEQQTNNSKLQNEIDSLKHELEKVNLENIKLREIKVNLTVTHKRSILSILEHYLIKKSN